jgi:hemerythrin-like domain-containing protein
LPLFEQSDNDRANRTRRQVMLGAVTTGSALLIESCGSRKKAPTAAAPADAEDGSDEQVVTATEDLMREHGVLRRVLLVYAESAQVLRHSPTKISPDSLHKAAQLFREFGEDYHEKKLEEAYIFPVVRKLGGEAATYPEILVAQHQRGREITEYILSATNSPKLAATHGEALAQAMDALVRMYENHAAREDTIVFPAWKKSLTDHQLDEMSDKFEEIERQQFGHDGFDDAVKRVAAIEGDLGFADLAQFTAPPPPKPLS